MARATSRTQCAGVVDLPRHDDVLMHARGLDEFCAGVDLQLGVNIVSTPAAPFAGTKLRGLAEAAGLAAARRRLLPRPR